MKNIFVVAVLIIAGSVAFAQPVISSFSPQAALPASTVTISGSGFSPVADSNIVFFGAVKASVNTASVNQLNVTVPVGASYSTLSVTSGGLTGLSQLAFNPVTSLAVTVFDSSSFEPPVIIPTAPSDAKYTINMYDIDGDGKQDIISTDSNTTFISLIKNISQKGIINNASFAQEQKENDLFNWSRMAVQVSDFNGDGKKDIAYTGNYEIKILKNTSTINTFQFALVPVLNEYISGLASGDLDADGKIDLVTGKNTGRIRILKNTTPLYGELSFDTLPVLTNGTIPSPISGIALGDIDGDGKPEIIYSTRTGTLYMLINTSSGGSISFGTALVFTGGPGTVAIADLDNDGKQDVVCSDLTSISIFRNTSTIGNISFAPKIDLAAGSRTMNITISDFDGDGLADIGCAENIDYSVNSYIGLFKNNSTAGNINFAARVDYKVREAVGIGAGDIDGDGKQDIIAGCYYPQSQLAVLRNKMGEASSTLCSSTTSYLLQTNLTGPMYNWQQSTDGINFSTITDNANFSGSNTAALQLNNINTSWYGYQFRCMVNGRFEKIFTLTFKNTWTGSINSNWENPGNWSCNALPDSNTDVVITNGNVVLSSNATCRTLKVLPGASFTVAPGFTLTITH